MGFKLFSSRKSDRESELLQSGPNKHGWLLRSGFFFFFYTKETNQRVSAVPTKKKGRKKKTVSKIFVVGQIHLQIHIKYCIYYLQMYSMNAFYWANVNWNHTDIWTTAHSSWNNSSMCPHQLTMTVFTFLVRQCSLVAIVIIMLAKEEVV